VSPSVAEWIVRIAGAYLGLGVVFAIPFGLFGARRVDPAAARAPAGARLLVLPGAIVLWPLALFRWAAGRREPPVEHNAHRDAARERP
jgi:hypothetical protein